MEEVGGKEKDKVKGGREGEGKRSQPVRKSRRRAQDPILRGSVEKCEWICNWR